MEQKIKIKIAEKVFELNAKSQEQEEIIRKAAAMVNSQLTSYQQKFQSKNMDDIFSFIALNDCMTIISLTKQLDAYKKEVQTLQGDLKSYLDNIENI